jgi:L-serine kinase (ADP)
MADAPPQITLLQSSELQPHEEVIFSHACAILLWMLWTREFPQAILVDGKTGTILDGHHRWWVSKKLGLRVIPCYCVDYLEDATIRCEPRRKDVAVDKEAVIERAAAGNVFPAKTTRHIYQLPQISAYRLGSLI